MSFFGESIKPMTDEEELIGEPLEEVPQREPGDYCNGRRKKSRDGELVEDDEGRKIFAGYCQLVSGWGTEDDTGRCRKHGGSGGSGGSRDGAGAPENNTNATTHGGYTDEQSFYANELNEAQQDLADEIFDDYVDEYEQRHGTEPPKGLELELERLAISHVKDIVLDQWASQRPESLDSGNALVDRETERDFNPEDGSVVVEKYKESVVIQAQRKLSSDRRQWLKDLGLLEDPESQTAASIDTLADVMSEE